VLIVVIILVLVCYCFCCHRKSYDIDQNGQPQSSNGQPQSSNGQPQSSNGQPQSSNGQPQSSNGQPQSSNGQPQSPNGQPSFTDQSLPPNEPSPVLTQPEPAKSTDNSSKMILKEQAVPNEPVVVPKKKSERYDEDRPLLDPSTLTNKSESYEMVQMASYHTDAVPPEDKDDYKHAPVFT
jgi:hypothetical protein